MKAIQVKRLPWTSTKPERLKAFIKGHSLTMSDFDLNERISNLPDFEAWGLTPERVLVNLFMDKLGWTEDVEIVGKGVLPNEDIVFILKQIS